MLYTYHLKGSFSNINLITNNRFLAEHDNCASIGWISNENELICNFYGGVIRYDKSYKNPSIYNKQGNI